MYSSLLSCRKKRDCRVWRGLSPEMPCSGPSGMSTTSLCAKHIHHQWRKKHSSLSSPMQSLPPQKSVRGFPGTWRLWLDICNLDTSASETYQGQKYKWKGLQSSHSSWHPCPSSLFFRISIYTLFYNKLWFPGDISTSQIITSQPTLQETLFPLVPREPHFWGFCTSHCQAPSTSQPAASDLSLPLPSLTVSRLYFGVENLFYSVNNDNFN